MKAAISRWFAVAAALLVIAFGCDSVLNQVADDGAGGGDGFATLDSEFSDASVTPGGIGVPDGGVPDPDPDTEIVELPSQETRSFFTAFQIDPVEEDTAGAKFVVAGDVDQDGLLDLVSGWNESQPIQLYLQRRDPTGVISFRTITLAGTYPVAAVAGVELGQINGDGWLDVVVLVKASGAGGMCPPKHCVNDGDCAGDVKCSPSSNCCEGNCDPTQVSRLEGQIIVYFSPGNAGLIPDGDRWRETILVNPLVLDDIGVHWRNQFPGKEYKPLEEAKVQPEWSGFTSLVVADMDGLNGDDILVALNPAACDAIGQSPPTNTVDLWVNPGGALAENPVGWGAPTTLMADLPQVKDVEVMDIDSDGDLDVIATYTDAITRNIRWARNPRPGGAVTGAWEQRPIAQLDTGADIMTIGDIDRDGMEDILVRSTNGRVVQWFRRPNPLVIEPEFPPNDTIPDRTNFPWPVFTLTEFTDQLPEAVSLGDVTGDGRLELIIAVEGGVYWYDSTVGDSVYDPWFGNTIIQDDPTADGETALEAPGGSGVGVGAVDTTTAINSLLVVDLDGDGRNDIVGTLDRRTGSGLSDDRLVWYRNTKTED